MKQAILLLFVFLCCLSFKEGSSKESCPNAKNSIENDKVEFLLCWGGSEDPCSFNVKSDLHFIVDFNITVPEDALPVIYEVLFTGDGINATDSGEAYVDEEENLAEAYAQMKGDMPVGHNGVATVSLYYNGEKKDIPDWCARTNLKIVSFVGN